MRTAAIALATLSVAIGCQGTSVQVLESPLYATANGDSCLTRDGGVTLPDAGAAPGPHGGTWSTYAHDFQRTSRADGTGQMRAPEVAWTQRMGGLLDRGQAVVADADGDGLTDVVAISGGRVTAARSDGSTLWQGPLAGAYAVLGVWNLDGIGSPEVVVNTSTGVRVLGGADGRELTTLVASPNRSAATFLATPPAGGILIVGTDSMQVAAFDFRHGTHVTAPLWIAKAGATLDAVLGDVDGDGVVDLVRELFPAGLQVLDPLTGQVKYEADGIGPPAYFYWFELADVDGKPGLEIVVTDTSYLYSPTTGIYVLGVRGGALTTLWSSTAQPQVALGADFYTVAGSVADLDGDGTKELVFSQWDGATQTWTTRIVDAATGVPIADLPSQLVQAIADVDGDGKVDIVVRSNPLADRTPARSDLRVYELPSRSSAPVAKPWVLPRAHVMMRAPSVLPYDGSLDTPAAADFDPSPGARGVELLVGEDDANRGSDGKLAILRGDGSLAATAAITQGVTPSVLWWGAALTAPSSVGDVLSFGDDGIGHVLTRGLAERAHFRAGSYANWPRVYGLDATRTMLAMATSNRDLLWIDGTHLRADGTPSLITHVPGVVDISAQGFAGAPLDPLTYLPGSSPRFVAYEQGETAVTMVGMDTAGVEIWHTDLANGATLWMPGGYAADVRGAGQADLIVPLFDIHTIESLAIFDCATGTIARSTPLQTIVASGDNLTAGSLVDVNGDGVVDLVTPVHSIGLVAVDLAASPMNAIWTIPGSMLPASSGTIGAARVDAQGVNLLRFDGNAGFGPYARLSLAGNVLASQDQGSDVDSNAVAFVQRVPGASVYDLISAGSHGASLSRVRRIAGDTLAPVWTRYLSLGTASSAVPAQPFALHDPIAVDVDGDGADEVVLGSDDGFLYALHASDGSIAFTLDLGAPVTRLIAADIDRDVAVELVASLADGRLVAIDEPGHYDAIRDSPASGRDAGDGRCPSAGDDASQPHSLRCQTGAGIQSRDGLWAWFVVLEVVVLRLRRSRPSSPGLRLESRAKPS